MTAIARKRVQRYYKLNEWPNLFSFFRSNPQFINHFARHKQAKQDRRETTERIEEEIPPLGSTSGGERLLPYLYQSAEENGGHDSSQDKSYDGRTLMASIVLKPDYTTKAKVHQKMQHFINIGHLIEWRLRRIEEWKKEDNTKNKKR